MGHNKNCKKEKCCKKFKKGDTCPITMELLSPITASVTSCYHVFDTEAIDHWLTEHKTCPVCKQACSSSKAFI